MNSIIRRRGDGNGAAIGTGGATGEHECVKIVGLTSAIEGMRRLDPRSLSLETSIAPIGQIVEVWTVGGGPDHPGSTGRDVHLHLHSEMIRRKSKKGAVKRDRVARIGRGRNGDQADVADAAAGRIEIDPTSAGQVDLRPSVSRPVRRAARRFLRIVEVDCEIPEANRAAKPNERAASIISMAKSRQLPWPRPSVSNGGWIPFASRRL